MKDDQKATQRTQQKSEVGSRIAPGVEGLEQVASPEDLAQGNAARVTKLIYDEMEQPED